MKNKKQGKNAWGVSYEGVSYELILRVRKNALSVHRNALFRILRYKTLIQFSAEFETNYILEFLATDKRINSLADKIISAFLGQLR